MTPYTNPPQESSTSPVAQARSVIPLDPSLQPHSLSHCTKSLSYTIPKPNHTLHSGVIDLHTPSRSSSITLGSRALAAGVHSSQAVARPSAHPVPGQMLSPTILRGMRDLNVNLPANLTTKVATSYNSMTPVQRFVAETLGPHQRQFRNGVVRRDNSDNESGRQGAETN